MMINSAKDSEPISNRTAKQGVSGLQTEIQGTEDDAKSENTRRNLRAKTREARKETVVKREEIKGKPTAGGNRGPKRQSRMCSNQALDREGIGGTTGISGLKDQIQKRTGSIADADEGNRGTDGRIKCDGKRNIGKREIRTTRSFR